MENGSGSEFKMLQAKILAQKSSVNKTACAFPVFVMADSECHIEVHF